MEISVPTDWREVEPEQFREYLKTCNDYIPDAYCGGVFYRFRHNSERFAAEMDDGRILVSPKILSSPKRNPGDGQR